MSEQQSQGGQSAAPAQNNDSSADRQFSVASGATEAIEGMSDSGNQASTSSAEDAIEAAHESGQISAAEAKELKKRLKLKIDGQEIEEEIDFNDDDGLKRHLQKSKAFDKRVKEFTGFKSQVDQFFQQLQQDPEAILEQLGFNVDDLATKRLQRKVEEMQKSPEQLEKEKMAKELETLRKEKEALKKAQEDAQMESLRNQQAAEIENSISSALDDSKSRLPKNNPKVMAMIAQNMLMAIENGYNDVTVSDIIPIVERQWKDELRSYFDTSSEDLIEELVGKGNLDRLRKKRLSKRPKAAEQMVPVNKQILDTGSAKPKEEAPKVKKTYRDFFRS